MHLGYKPSMEKPKYQSMMVRFPRPLHRRLKMLAARDGCSMTAIVIEAVDAAVSIREEEAALESVQAPTSIVA